MTQGSKLAEPKLGKVKTMIDELVLAGQISLGAVAMRLQISPRTLQRRLNTGGVSFQALVEQSRFKMARALLRETDLKIQVIAVRLGYRRPGAFTRAFSRWAGCSPSAYRKAHPRPTHIASDWRKMGRGSTQRRLQFAPNQELPKGN